MWRWWPTPQVTGGRDPAITGALTELRTWWRQGAWKSFPSPSMHATSRSNLIPYSCATTNRQSRYSSLHSCLFICRSQPKHLVSEPDVSETSGPQNLTSWLPPSTTPTQPSSVPPSCPPARRGWSRAKAPTPSTATSFSSGPHTYLSHSVSTRPPGQVSVVKMSNSPPIR